MLEYLSRKRNEVLIHTSVQISFENVTQNKGNQSQKGKNNMIYSYKRSRGRE